VENGLTHEEMVVACRNIGFDLTCGACASLFYTGTAPYAHDTSCQTPGTTKGEPCKRCGRYCEGGSNCPESM
jgi:hypothetical protein